MADTPSDLSNDYTREFRDVEERALVSELGDTCFSPDYLSHYLHGL